MNDVINQLLFNQSLFAGVPILLGLYFLYDYRKTRGQGVPANARVVEVREAVTSGVERDHTRHKARFEVIDGPHAGVDLWQAKASNRRQYREGDMAQVIYDPKRKRIDSMKDLRSKLVVAAIFFILAIITIVGPIILG